MDEKSVLLSKTSKNGQRKSLVEVNNVRLNKITRRSKIWE